MSGARCLQTAVAKSALVAALQRENAEYMRLLTLLDEQQDQIVLQNGSEVLRLSEAIEKQMREVKARREQRETMQRGLSEKLGLATTAELSSVATVVNGETEKTIRALGNDMNTLLLRVRHRARENQALMGRSVELMQKVRKFRGSLRGFDEISRGAEL